MKEYVEKEEISRLLDEFESNAEAKLASKVPRYGKLEGDDATFDQVVEHLLDEFAEFIAAYANSISDVLELSAFVFSNAQHRFMNGEKDITTELYDLHNVAKIAWVYGVYQEKLKYPEH